MKVLIHGLPNKTPTAIMEELKAAKLKPLQVIPIRRMQDGNPWDQLYLEHGVQKVIYSRNLTVF